MSVPGIQQQADKEKALYRVEWLRALAEQLLQEANELEAKWGRDDFGDAMNLDVSANAADGAAGAPDVAGGEPVKAMKDGKVKKSKRKATTDAMESTMNAEATQPGKPSTPSLVSDAQDVETSAVTKSKKDKKRKRQALDKEVVDTPAKTEDAGASVETSSVVQTSGGDQLQTEKDLKKSQKALKKANKKAKKAKDKDEPQDADIAGAPDKNHVSSPAYTDKWNVNALGGGAERQNKFMKLLGGGKAGPPSSSPRHSGEARSKIDIQRAQDDLQRQYDTGMSMKFEGQGQRRGLGA